MPIYKNGEKIVDRKMSFSEFCDKAAELARRKGVNIHMDFELSNELERHYKRNNMEAAVSAYVENAMKWE